jgi:hypothetical protein
MLISMTVHGKLNLILLASEATSAYSLAITRYNYSIAG